MQKNIFEKIVEKFEKEEKIAFIELDKLKEKKILTYKQIISEAKRISKRLKDKKMENAIAIIYMPATIDVSIIALACFISNITPIFKTIFDEIEEERFDYQFTETLNTVKKVDLVIVDKNRVNLKEKCLKNKINFFSLEDENDSVCDYKINRNKKFCDWIITSSGTTSSCKAIKLSFDNIEYSLNTHKAEWQVDESSITLSWSPHSHVLGLMAGFLLPIYTGSQSIILNPQDFVKDPLILFDIINKYKVTNLSTTLFGIEALNNMYDKKRLQNINLSSLRCISATGEILKSEILNKFEEIYLKYGLKNKVLAPSYGMSENAGVISWISPEDETYDYKFDPEGLLYDKLIPTNKPNYISCVSVGTVIPGTYIYIIDNKNKILSEGNIGEIVVSSPALSENYINVEDNKSFIKLKCIEDGEVRRFLKTGDQGGFYKGNLFITGRIKDIINIKGKKYSPYDIEKILMKHLIDKIKAVVAFSSEIRGKEKVIVFQEVANVEEIDKQKIFEETKNVIKKKMNLNVFDIMFLKTNEIPRTESKKVQRQKCKNMYLDYYNKNEKSNKD